MWLAERQSDIVRTRLALKLPLDATPEIDAVRREADLWVKASSHPNVLPLFEAASYDGQIVIASEYVPGGSLQDWLDEQPGGRAPLEPALDLMQGILRGLAHLHAREIVHRDLKPANVLMQHDTPRLADFGLARLFDTRMQSSLVAGTPHYMPPEAFSGDYSPRTDLWSAGVILVRLLTGQLPFPSPDLAAVMREILTGEPVPLPTSIPAQIRDVIATALTKDVSRRFASAEQMRAALLDSARPAWQAPAGQRTVPDWGEFVDPDRDCGWSQSRGIVTLLVPGRDHDLMAERGKMNAPRIVQPVEGDFILQVHISGSLSPQRSARAEALPYQGAGLLLMQDERTYVRLERACLTAPDGRFVYINHEVRLNGQVLAYGRGPDHPLDEDADTVLRLERIGDRLVAAVSQDESGWLYLKAQALALAPALHVGIAAVNASTQAFAPEFHRLRLFRAAARSGPADGAADDTRVPDTLPPGA